MDGRVLVVQVIFFFKTISSTFLLFFSFEMALIIACLPVPYRYCKKKKVQFEYGRVYCDVYDGILIVFLYTVVTVV